MAKFFEMFFLHHSNDGMGILLAKRELSTLNAETNQKPDVTKPRILLHLVS